jgi:hypothetical protein
MAQIPSHKRIIRDLFPADLTWMPRLLSPLNKFMEDVTSGFNKRLTIADNFDGEIKSVVFNGTYPVNLAWNRPSKATIGLIGKIEMVDGSDITLSQAIVLNWQYNQSGQIQINDVIGLDDTVSKQYRLTLVFLVG